MRRSPQNNIHPDDTDLLAAAPLDRGRNLPPSLPVARTLLGHPKRVTGMHRPAVPFPDAGTNSCNPKTSLRPRHAPGTMAVWCLEVELPPVLNSPLPRSL